MSLDSLKTDLKDVSFTVPTPFTPNGDEVDREALANHVEWLSDAGGKVMIPCGNTGEYYSLSHAERVAAVETTVNAMDGRGRIVAGAGGSTKTALQLIRQYEDAGADAVMIMSPHHTYLHEAGVREYYEEIASATDLGIVLYKRGEELSDETIQHLSTLENVVAVKYAINDIKSFASTVEGTPGDVVFLNGLAERYTISFDAEGAGGYTTGLGNFLPDSVLQLWDALESGDVERARRIRELLRPIEDLREETGQGNHMASANNVPTVKHGLELVGVYSSPVREPLIELSENDQERLQQYIETVRTEL